LKEVRGARRMRREEVRKEVGGGGRWEEVGNL
jgi:hypothetical protein